MPVHRANHNAIAEFSLRAGEAVQNFGQMLAQEIIGSGFIGWCSLIILDEITEYKSSSSSVGVSSERGRRATWIIFSTFLGRNLQSYGHFLHSWLACQGAALVGAVHAEAY